MNSKIAELYLSFAGIFHRPHPVFAENMEELLELWREEIPEASAHLGEIEEYCRKYSQVDDRMDVLWEHYIPLFEAGEIEAIPYASVYFNDNGLILGKEAEEVRGFYLSCGYDIGNENQELPDHLAVELEFLALLARDKKTKELAEFENKHLKPFLRVILPRIIESKRSVYSNVAKILEIWIGSPERKGD